MLMNRKTNEAFNFYQYYFSKKKIFLGGLGSANIRQNQSMIQVQVQVPPPPADRANFY